jgi:hypothetical protein
LEEHAGKDVRQEEQLSALSAFDGFFGAWEITHGKSPTAPSNPLREEKKMLFKAVLRQSAGKSEACRYRWGRRRHASDFNPGFVTFVGFMTLDCGGVIYIKTGC